MDNPSNPSPPEAHGEVFPFVFTAARLTEHHTAGGMSRQLPYLAELQPALFVEVSPELAAERGLAHMDWAHVITSRTAVDARVFVTDRMTPLRVEDRVVHQIWMPYHWGATGLVDGDVVNDLLGVVVDPNVFIQESKVATCDIQPGRRPRGPALLEYIASYRDRAGITVYDGDGFGHDQAVGRPHRGEAMSDNSFYGPLDDPAGDAGYAEHPPRVGFFTDTSVCIGCKACEVACKEWNMVPDDGFNLLGMSFDNTGELGANTWRHVAFIEQPCGSLGRPRDAGVRAPGRCVGRRDPNGLPVADELRRVQALHACGMPRCVPDGCVVPHGVRHSGCAARHLQRVRVLRVGLPVRGDRAARGRRPGVEVHDVLRPAARRLGTGVRQGVPDGLDPVRPVGRVAGRAALRVEELHARGVTEARLYGHDPNDGVGGDGAFFLLLDEPEVYGLPPDPVVPTRDAGAMWKYAGMAASALVGLAVSAFVGRAR